MPGGEYYVGLAYFLVTFGAVFGAAELVCRKRLSNLEGATRTLAWATLATLGVVVAHLLPGAATVLSRETAAIVAVAMLCAAIAMRPGTAGAPVGFPGQVSGAGSLERNLAIAGVATFAIWAALAGVQILYTPVTAYDAVTAYLPLSAHWLQEGSIWGIIDWSPYTFYGSGPGHGSLISMATMLPWDSDFLARYAHYPFVAMMALGLYALGRELGASPAAAALGGVMLTAIPMVVVPGLDNALFDPLMYAGFVTGIFFLARHHRTGERSALVLAGIALGLAFGTKFYGYLNVPALLATWIAGRLLLRVPLGTVIRQGAAVSAIVLLVGGIWMLRNWIDVGNPLQPVQVGFLGWTVFDAPEDPLRPLIGDTLFEHLLRPESWAELADQFRVAVGVPLLVLGLAVLAAPVALIRRRRRGAADRGDEVAWALLAATVVLTIAYAITPYSGAGIGGEPTSAAINVRYGVPAMIAAAGLLAWLWARASGPVRGVIAVAAFVALIDTLRIGITTPRATVYSALVLGIVAAGLAALVRRRWQPARVPAAALAALAAVAVVPAALAGRKVEQEASERRYLGADPAIDRIIRDPRDDITVGIAGAWSRPGPTAIYPSFGPRLRHRVRFVGPVHGGLLETHRTRDSFVAGLAQIDPDLLLVGRAAPPLLDPAEVEAALRSGQPLTEPEGAIGEQRWARSAGFAPVLRSDRFVLMAPTAEEGS